MTDIEIAKSVELKKITNVAKKCMENIKLKFQVILMKK